MHHCCASEKAHAQDQTDQCLSQKPSIAAGLAHPTNEEFPSPKRKTGGFDLLSVSGHL